MRTTRSLLVAGCVLIFGAAGARAQQQTAGGVEPQAESIIKKLHQINENQAEIGKLAQQKGVSKEVREIGTNMDKKHADLDRKVMEVARKKGIDLRPRAGEAQPPGGAMEQLGMAGRQQFDREFLTTSLKEHADLIEELSQAPARITDSDVKKLVNDTLPQLHDDYEKISKTLARMKPAKQPGMEE